MSGDTTLTGPLPAQLGNAISDAIHDALQKGMEVDEAVCVVVAVAADYARGAYGDAYLAELATVITRRKERPMPKAKP